MIFESEGYGSMWNDALNKRINEFEIGELKKIQILGFRVKFGDFWLMMRKD